MEIKADEISKIIQKQIEGYETEIDIKEVGTVTSVGDGIARIYGLDRVMFNELLEFPNDLYGLALNLEEDSVGSVLLGSRRIPSSCMSQAQIQMSSAGPSISARRWVSRW